MDLIIWKSPLDGKIMPALPLCPSTGLTIPCGVWWCVVGGEWQPPLPTTEDACGYVMDEKEFPPLPVN